jgi:hypothetical protein
VPRLEGLEDRLCPSAFDPANLLVVTHNDTTHQDTLSEYTPANTLVQSFNIPNLEPTTGEARDVTVGTDGHAYVYNGTFSPHLSGLDPVQGTWSEATYPGWSTVANVSYGGVGHYQQYVFATDMNTAGAPEEGIVRFNTADGTAQRFADTQQYIALTVGLDGKLYGLVGSQIDVYDPTTLAPVRSVSLLGVVPDARGIAVNAAGDIFLSDWGGYVYHLNPSGQVVASFNTNPLNLGLPGAINDLYDIDDTTDGQLIVGTRFGDLIHTDEGLAHPSAVHLSSEGTFVAWVAPNAERFVVSGFPQSDTAGSSGSVTVTAVDRAGHVLTGYTGTVHLTSSDGQAVLPADYTFTAGDAGTHTFTGVTLKTAGTQSITAQDLNNSVSGTEGNISVSAAAATALRVSGYPSPATAGAAQTVTVTALDAYNNPGAAYTGTVHFTSSDGQAVLPADYPFSAADHGAHAFNVTLKTVGTQGITATDTVTSSLTGSQTGITVNPAAAASLAVTGLPASLTAGAAGNVTVTLKDAYGNLATGYRGTVHFTSSDTKAGLPADYAFTAGDGGTHTFSGGVTLKTAGSQAVTATDTMTGSLTGNQPGITVNPATATQLAVTTQPPATALLGTGFGLAVAAEDAYGNVVPTFSGTITVALKDNPTGATLGGTTSAPLSNGVATFSGLTLDKTGAGYTLQATGGGLTPATSNAFNVNSLALSPASVPEFRPVGTVVGTLSSTEPGSGHTFTYSLVSGAGSADNASFTVSGNQLLTADAFDSAAKSSYSIRVRSTDEANNTIEVSFTITVTADPNLKRTGRTLAVSGTSGNDTFTFSPGAVRHSLTLNGVNLAVDTASVDTITFNGGSDSVSLATTGSNNIVSLMPGGALLQGAGYRVSVGGAAQVSVYGGARDSAYFTDSPGSNSFLATPAYAYLTGGGLTETASGFGYVHATSSGGSDRASLYDSAGGASFLATPTYAYLAGSGFTDVVAGFPTVVANGAASDAAYLYGSPAGGGVLIGTPAYSYLYGGGYFNEAVGFPRVIGNASSPSDLAFLYGASGGGNVFVGTPAYGYLTGAGYFNDAVGFQRVTATAGAPSDAAYLYGAPGNVFAATSANAYLYGAGYFNDAAGFHSVYGYSGDAGRAYLLGTGTSADTFVNAGVYAYLYGDAFFQLASGFASVYANPYARH